MLIPTDRIKISGHAKQRLKERFNLKYRAQLRFIIKALGNLPKNFQLSRDFKLQTPQGIVICQWEYAIFKLVIVTCLDYNTPEDNQTFWRETQDTYYKNKKRS